LPRRASSRIESFAESLLPVLDSLEAGLAIQNATPEQTARGCRRHAAPAQERAGAQQGAGDQPDRGAKFDPHQHQAISMVPADQEANTVVTVLQKGY
jgi:molecular chaperone GrpE